MYAPTCYLHRSIMTVDPEASRAGAKLIEVLEGNIMAIDLGSRYGKVHIPDYIWNFIPVYI